MTRVAPDQILEDESVDALPARCAQRSSEVKADGLGSEECPCAERIGREIEIGFLAPGISGVPRVE